MLEPRLLNQGQMGNYELFVEPMATVWGFENTRGRQFKMSNADLVAAFREILGGWGDWTAARLNQNNINPDNTLVDFANDHFEAGGHKVAANDQRRGFLHLISTLAYLSQHEGPFDAAAAAQPLPREAYEETLRQLEEIEEHAQEHYRQRQQAPQGEPPPRGPAGIGKNLIIYGAPGTGKSHKVDRLIENHSWVRTVFHPDTQNSDFFGSLKPSMTENGVAYGFAPGPMARALLDAHNDPDHHHFLVIEELNRAPAAAVFGELFQLLDRQPDGSGTYTVDFPTQESKDWFHGNGYAGGKLALPSNLSILATMNSADQGVHPLDTAFRRRWEQEYMPLAKGDGPQGNLSFVGKNGEVREIGWKVFVSVLNRHLVDTLQVAEDRLLGLWFVKAAELGSNIPDKILLYLLDDLLRHEGRDHVFAPGMSGYGQLAGLVEDKSRILSVSLLERLENGLAARAHDDPEADDDLPNADAD